MRGKRQIVLSDFDVPTTEDTEALLLYELTTSPELILPVRKVVTENMFSNEKARNVWRVLLKKYDSHEKIDLTTMWASVDQSYFQKEMLGKSSRITFGESVSEHAKALRDVYISRTAYFNAVNTLQMIQDKRESSQIVAQYQSFQDELEKEIKDETTVTLTDAVNEVADMLQSPVDTKVPTGIVSLDYYTYGGWNGGNLWILAARPSVGKTTLMLQMAMAAARAKKHVIIFSLEMTKAELAQRILLSTGRIKPVQFYTKDLNWSDFEQAVSEVSNDYLMINDDTYALTDILRIIGEQKLQGTCDAVFIDYLQLMKMGDARQSVNQQVSEGTRTLKQTAKSYKIPIIALSQLSRSSVSEGRSPQLYDLRDSGSIEQDADGVIMLEKPRDLEDDENRIDAWLRKNRGGRRDVCISLRGDGNYLNFYENEQQDNQ